MAVANNDLLLNYLRYCPLDRWKHLFASKYSFGHLPKRFVHTHPLTGIRFELDLEDPGDRKLYLFNSIERNTERHLRKTLASLRPDFVIFDCGANMGFYSLLTCRLFPRASVHAFEPLPSTFEKLQRNIALNGFDRIRANQAALSDTSGRRRLFVGAEVGAASVFPVPGKPHEFEVETLSIDSYCERMGITRVDAMKIDTEGSERALLRGAKRTLEANPRIILVVEVMDENCRAAGYSGAELFEQLTSLGFSAFIPRGWPFGLQRVTRYPAGYFDNLFFLRGA